jgi:hypothetical protein
VVGLPAKSTPDEKSLPAHRDVAAAENVARESPDVAAVLENGPSLSESEDSEHETGCGRTATEFGI